MINAKQALLSVALALAFLCAQCAGNSDKSDSLGADGTGAGTSQAAGLGGSGGVTPPPVPQIVSVVVTPAPVGSVVSVNPTITVTFSEAMDPDTLTGNCSAGLKVAVLPSGDCVTVVPVWNSTKTVVEINPAGQLGYSTLYWVQLTTGVKSANGAALAAEQNNFWSTEAAPPSPQQWEFDAYLKAPNPGLDFQRGFYLADGHAVAIDGDIMAMGAPHENVSTTEIVNGFSMEASAAESGAVYIFRRSVNHDWRFEAYIKAPNSLWNGGFGYSLALSGNTLVVGSPNEKSNTTEILHAPFPAITDPKRPNEAVDRAGAVYVFGRAANGKWEFQAYLKQPNADDGEEFGRSVAISGKWIAAMGSGKFIDIFQQGTDSKWSHYWSIGTIPCAYSYYGMYYYQSLAIDADTLAIGCPAYATTGADTNSGGVFITLLTPGQPWKGQDQGTLRAPNPTLGAYFGRDVSLHKDTVVVGAHEESVGGMTKAGAAHVFKRTGQYWAYEAYLSAPDANANYQFGSAVALQNDVIVVGGGDRHSPSESGSVYIFRRKDNQWAHDAYLRAPNFKLGHLFGQSVAISNDTVVVRAPGESSSTNYVINGSNLSETNTLMPGAGAAYVYRLQCPAGQTCAP